MAFRTDYEVAPFLVECLSSLPLPFLLLVSMRVTAHGADLTDPRFWFDNPTRCEVSQQTSSGLVSNTGRPTLSLLFWSNYSDLTRPHPKWWFSKGNPLISGKSRLVNHYNWARLLNTVACFGGQKFPSPSTSTLSTSSYFLIGKTQPTPSIAQLPSPSDRRSVGTCQPLWIRFRPTSWLT